MKIEEENRIEIEGKGEEEKKEEYEIGGGEGGERKK